MQFFYTRNSDCCFFSCSFVIESTFKSSFSDGRQILHLKKKDSDDIENKMDEKTQLHIFQKYDIGQNFTFHPNL